MSNPVEGGRPCDAGRKGRIAEGTCGAFPPRFLDDQANTWRLSRDRPRGVPSESSPQSSARRAGGMVHGISIG